MNVKALANFVILQLMLQMNFSKTDKSNIYGVDFFNSGLLFQRIDESNYINRNLLPCNKFDQFNDHLTMIDNLLDQLDMIIDKSK
jgi:hypothetical protein